MKFKTWWKCYRNKLVVLRTITDSAIDGYRYECHETIVSKAELPTQARHCRGESMYWSLDLTAHSNDVDKYPDGASANDLHRHMHTTVFNNLLYGLWKEVDHLNVKKILVILGIVAAVIIGFYVFRGGM